MPADGVPKDPAAKDPAPRDPPVRAAGKDPAPAEAGSFFKLRDEPSSGNRLLLGAFALAILGGVWTVLTWGPAETRVLSPAVLGSPNEVFGSFKELWFDRALMRNLIASLWRVAQGFGLAIAVGVPLGIAAGTWPRLHAFLAPISIFGRNVPISALVPLTLVWFGIEELQKVMFIFVATVMFVFYDSARAIASVHERYVQSAFTLGASPFQVVAKVLVPLALPEIFGSLRALFGVAFGYIILAEMVNMTSGVGALILVSQRRGPMEHVYLILAAMTLVAFGLDRLLHKLQRWLFPYREA
jgi:ABC-type nitrate/sulfonate/bicarbonate transport system permease component